LGANYQVSGVGIYVLKEKMKILKKYLKYATMRFMGILIGKNKI